MLPPQGHPRFFLGSDSAPHPPQSKSTSTPMTCCAAGVYTSPILLPLLANLLESFGALDKLEGFASTFGRAFYKQPITTEPNVILKKIPGKVVQDKWDLGNQSVISFWAGKELEWEISSRERKAV